VLVLGWQITLKWARTRSRDPFLDFGALVISLEQVKFGTSDLVVCRFTLMSTSTSMVNKPPEEDMFRVTWRRRSYDGRLIGNYVACQMAPIAITLKVIFDVWNLSDFHTSGKYSMYYARRVYMRMAECMWPTISTVLLKLKDFWRPQAITDNVKVVISWKWCKTETFTNRKSYLAYRIVAIPVHLIQAFWYVIVCTVVQQLTIF